MNIKIGNIILFICSIVSLYFIIQELSPILLENKILYEGNSSYMTQQNKLKERKFISEQEKYFKGRDIERLDKGATRDMKWINIIDENAKYKIDKSALPANFSDPNSSEKYMNSYVHKFGSAVPNNMNLEPRPSASVKIGLKGGQKEIPIKEGLDNQNAAPVSAIHKKINYATGKKSLKVISPGAEELDSEIKKKIEKCRSINEAGANCNDLANTECGYCLDTDKAYYGDKNGPLVDVCQKKSWVAPGPKVVYYCTRAKERRICKEMKDCGDVAGSREICGWCPYTEQGMVKKRIGNGYDPKYSEKDQCSWKSTQVQAKWKGWLSAEKTNGNLREGEGNCETDNECGTGLKCGTQYTTENPPGITGNVLPKTRGGDKSDIPVPIKWFGWTPTNKYPMGDCEGDCDNDSTNCAGERVCHHNAKPPGCTGATVGNGDYCSRLNPNPKKVYGNICYDPNKVGWEGSLIIGSSACSKFAQNFPCVGSNMMTGPHNNNCLNDIWKKSGCNGDVNQRINALGDEGRTWKDFLQSNAYTLGQDSMYNKSKIMFSDDYYKANPASQLCTGQTVDVCKDKYVAGTDGGRPKECLSKLYKQGGCTTSGKLNPDTMSQYANSTGTSGIKTKTVTNLKTKWNRNQITDFYTQAKTRAEKGKRNPSHDFNDAVYRNELCYGTQPKVPFDKPCWNDFSAQMVAHKNAELSDDKETLKLGQMVWKGLQDNTALNKMDGTVTNKKLASIQTVKNVSWHCDKNRKDTRKGITGKYPIPHPVGDKISLNKCKEECAAEPECVKFNHFGKKGDCQLLTGKPVRTKQTNKRDKVTNCIPKRPGPHTSKWGTNWSISKNEYGKPYFPFWNFLFKSRERKSSKPSWTKFKSGMLKIPGIKNKNFKGADALVYEEFGYFGDLFRRLKYNYRKPFNSDWKYMGSDGADLGPVNGRVRYMHPATNSFKEKTFNGENASCTKKEFGGRPTTYPTGCYRYDPSKGQKVCSSGELVASGQCSDRALYRFYEGKNQCSKDNIGTQPLNCDAPDELGKRIPYVITQALFETDDFPYWQFERTMTRNL